mmetsp:Transcript_37097/g.37774  ORF Transcript_37097/g.37774 Transcript_37097/m.37774 type:complete len:94 (-) Transcript_37097:102-383(-)
MSSGVLKEHLLLAKERFKFNIKRQSDAREIAEVYNPRKMRKKALSGRDESIPSYIDAAKSLEIQKQKRSAKAIKLMKLKPKKNSLKRFKNRIE